MDLLKKITGGQPSATGGKPEETPVTGDKPAPVEPRHVTGEEFEAVVLKSEIPAVVDFWAEWCGPCHAIAPAVAQLAREYAGRVVVAKVNADDYPEILMNYGIMGIPTLIYFKNGQEVDRIVGLTQYGALKKKMDRVLG
jgi:thioredoxin 1